MKMRGVIVLAFPLFLTAGAWADAADGTRGRMGPGMMGELGMGPHAMYGYGMGAGMMGGCGPGSLMANIPDLTSEQRAKISDIRKEFRRKQWGLMEKMHEDAQSGNFYRGGKFDEQAARKHYDAAAGIHKQMFENAVDAQKRIDSVLTPKQREQLQQATGSQ